MKMFIIYGLLFLLTFQSFSKVVYVMVWKWNQEVISKTLCINKDKPSMKCKGKCQLMLAEKNPSPDQQSPPPISKKVIEWPMFFSDNQTNGHFINKNVKKQNIHHVYLLKHLQEHVRDLIKPPEFRLPESFT